MVVLLGLLIYTATAGGSVVASLLGFVTSPMQSVSTQVTGSVTEFVDLDALSRDELKEMVNSLSQENATLREQLVDYENTQKENEQLKVQLDITEDAPENTLRAATVIGRDPNDAFYGFSIDQGHPGGHLRGGPGHHPAGACGRGHSGLRHHQQGDHAALGGRERLRRGALPGGERRHLQRHHLRQRGGCCG